MTFAALCTSLFVYGFVGDLMGEVGEVLRSTAIFMTVGLAMVGATICLWRGMAVAAFLTVAGFSSVFISLYIFSMNSGVPFTFGAGGQYIGLSFIGLFALTLKDGHAGTLFRWFFGLTCLYAVFFIAALAAIRLGVVDVGSAIRGVVSADDVGRGTRLHASAFPLIYGTTYSVVSFQKRPTISKALLILLFALTFWVTESRTITALVFIAVSVHFVLRRPILFSRGSFAIYLVGAIGSVLILLQPDLNPFSYTTDYSAQVRENTVNIASNLIRYYWVFGSGLSFGIEGYAPLAGVYYFFPGDIGLMGILFSYGIFGLLGYSFIVYLGCFSYKKLLVSFNSAVIAESVTVTASIIAVYSLLSPQYDGGSSGSILAMLLIALKIHRPQQTMQRSHHRDTSRYGAAV